jgi:hypothetical protein
MERKRDKAVGAATPDSGKEFFFSPERPKQFITGGVK